MKLSRITIFIISLLTFTALPALSQDAAYYGFYPSEAGPTSKKLRHNMLKFEIDIPVEWSFGVSTEGENIVVFLHESNFDTAKLGPNYKVIEIGNLGAQEWDLQKIYQIVWRSLQLAHGNFVKRGGPTKGEVNGYPSLSFDYSWESKNGHNIHERVYLIQTEEGVRSLGIRVGESALRDLPSLEKITHTFQPL